MGEIGVDAVAFALTGERVTLAAGPVVERLAALGWTQERVIALRDDRFRAGQPWPVPVPREFVPGGFAAFVAELAHARSELGLDVVRHAPAPTRPLNTDERRLVADRPPHW